MIRTRAPALVLLLCTCLWVHGARLVAHDAFWSGAQPQPVVGLYFVQPMLQFAGGLPRVRTVEENEIGHRVWDGLHFTPTRSILTPALSLAPRVETALTIRVLLYAAAALAVGAMGARVTRDRWAGVALGLAFLATPLTLITQRMEFRSLQLAAPFLILCGAAQIAGWPVAALVAGVLALGAREEVFWLLLAMLPALAMLGRLSPPPEGGPFGGRRRRWLGLGALVVAILLWRQLVLARQAGSGTSRFTDVEGLIGAVSELLPSLFRVPPSGHRPIEVLVRHYLWFLGPALWAAVAAPSSWPAFALWGAGLIFAGAGPRLGGPVYIVAVLGVLPLAWCLALARLRTWRGRPAWVRGAALLLLLVNLGATLTVQSEAVRARRWWSLWTRGGWEEGAPPPYRQPWSHWALAGGIPAGEPVMVSGRLEEAVGHRPVFYTAKHFDSPGGYRPAILRMVRWVLLTEEEAERWRPWLDEAGFSVIVENAELVLLSRSGGIDGDPLTPYPEPMMRAGIQARARASGVPPGR